MATRTSYPVPKSSSRAAVRRPGCDSQYTARDRSVSATKLASWTSGEVRRSTSRRAADASVSKMQVMRRRREMSCNRSTGRPPGRAWVPSEGSMRGCSEIRSANPPPPSLESGEVLSKGEQLGVTGVPLERAHHHPPRAVSIATLG